MKPFDFFLQPNSIAQKQYEALRMYFVEKQTAAEVALKYGYTYRGFTTIISEFRKKIDAGKTDGLFFSEKQKGRKITQSVNQAKDIIISLRKKYYSVEDIKVVLDSKMLGISEKTIYNTIAKEGFSKLPRRTRLVKQQKEIPQIQAEKSIPLSFVNEDFKSSSAGILCLLPYIKNYGIDEIITHSGYPQTNSINRLSSILTHIAALGVKKQQFSVDNPCIY